MKKIDLVLATLFLVSLLLPTAALAAAQGTDESVIREIDAAWSDALGRRSLDEVASVYADHAVLLAPGQPIVRGKTAIREWFRVLFERPGYQASFVPTRITVAKSGDVAYETGTFRAQGRRDDGALLTSVGKHLVAWEKRDGKWLVTAESISTDGEPTVATGERAAAANCDIALASSTSGNGAQHVVLIGGLSASPEEWRQVREGLASGHTVHVVSVPGLGGVPAAGHQCDSIDIGTVASALGKYIARNIAPHKPVVIGHSAGGLATLQLAGTHGDLLAGIVVVDALPFMSANFGASGVDDALEARIHEEHRQILSESPAAFAERLHKQLRGAVRDPATATRIAAVAAASDRRTYAALYSSTMLSDLRGMHMPRGLPAFVVFADQRSNGAPPGFMPKRYETQYAWLPSDHLLEVGDAGHYLMLDQPRAFLAYVRKALEAI